MTAHLGFGFLAARSNSQIASRTALIAGQIALAMWLGVVFGPSAVHGAETPSMVFVPAGEADQASRMAVHWSGAPATTVSAWLDFNGDGLWQDREQVLWQALLAEEMTLFDIEAPDGAQLLPDTRVRLRAHPPGAQPRDSFHTTGGLVGCSWSEEFRSTGMDDVIWSLGTFDDGTGLALYAGGLFSNAASEPALGIARWNGTSWSALGSGLDSLVEALVVFDDGSGPALYAAGQFETAGGLAVNKIAKWDGSSWFDVGGGVTHTGGGGSISALEVFDDGAGPALYAGGRFTHAGGVAATNLARWDGTTWSEVSGGVNSFVRTMKVFEHNSAPALMIGGVFTQAGGLTAGGVAAFSGGTWSAVSGSGFSYCDPMFGCMAGDVLSLEVFDDGSGPALFAGGGFTHAGGAPVAHVAKLQGTSWVGLAGGTLNAVWALKAYDSGSGPELFAGMDFNTSSAVNPQMRIAKWDGTSWTALANGADDGVFAFEVFDAGDGEKLYLGGEFEAAGGVGASRIATWDGSSWAPLSEAQGMSQSISTLATLEFAGDTSVYALGNFDAAGTTAARRIARWDGDQWHALGEGLDRATQSLAVYDDGSGEALYVGGQFFAAGGAFVEGIAQWDGTTWAGVGGGMTGGGTSRFVSALTVFDDGGGPMLFAAGLFTSAGGTPVNNIAKWDGSSWVDVGGGFDQPARALTVFDDGNGPALYAAGNFSIAGGASANRIAKWDGTSWSALSTGMNGVTVLALAVFNDGNGPALYAGGDFDTVGGVSASRIAKWDGTAWSPLTTGLDSDVYSLAVLDEGPESALYVAGNFTTAGGLPANGLARWDGTLWSPTNGGGVDSSGSVFTLAAFDGPGGPSLFAGGSFEGIGGVLASYIASYQCSGLFSDGFESGDTTAWTTTNP